MANPISISRIETLTLSSAIVGIVAANTFIYRESSVAVALGIGALFGAATWCLFLLAKRMGGQESEGSSGSFPPFLQAAIMCTALAIPAIRVYLSGHEGRVDSLLMESMRNLSATSAIFSFDHVRRRATMFIGLLLVLFAFTLESSLVVTLCLFLQLTIAAFWLAANEQQAWVQDEPSEPIRWHADFIVGCFLLVAVGFGVAVLFYSNQQRRVDKSFDGLAQDSAREFGDDYSFQQEEDEEVVQQSTEKALGADAAKSADKQGNDPAQDQSLELDKELYRQFSTIRTPSDQDQEFKKLFNLDANQVRHIPSAHFDQFNGKQWLADKRSHLAPNSAQISHNQALLKFLHKEDLDFSKITSLPDVNDENFLEEARSMMFQSMADQGAGTISPDLFDVPPDKLRRWMESSPNFQSDASLVITHYELEALAEDMRSDPKLLWKFLASTRGADLARSGPLERLRMWRRNQDKPLLPPKLLELVEKWTAGTKPGWQEVMGIVNGLRNHAQYDPTATVPADETDSVYYFLVESKRGPDYLFASSAVVLLRSLGYPSRLVGGYYAKPEKRSWLSGNVTIAEDDVHYWAQVKLDDRIWVDIEPTPGFDIPGDDAEQQQTVLASIWGFLADHGPRLAAGLLCLLVLGWVLKRPFRYGWIYLSWRLGLGRSPRQIVRATQRLLDERLKAAGLKTPQGHSFASAILSLAPHETRLQRFHALGQQAMYQDQQDDQSTLQAELSEAAKSVVAWLTPRRLRETKRITPKSS